MPLTDCTVQVLIVYTSIINLVAIYLIGSFKIILCDREMGVLNKIYELTIDAFPS